VKRDQLPVVVFDGDDTLWITEPLYDSARDAARSVVEQVGLNGTLWEELQRSIDLRNVDQFGLIPTRFPTSCRQAYEELSKLVGVEPNILIARDVYNRAAEVFLKVAPLVPGATKVVKLLRRKFRLVLLTQGDERVQSNRITDSGLEGLFDVIRIVPKKTRDLLAKLLDELGANPKSSWMVGNSVPSDINPALAIGMKAIWIDTYSWEHERREQPSSSKGLTKISPLGMVPEVILNR